MDCEIYPVRFFAAYGVVAFGLTRVKVTANFFKRVLETEIMSLKPDSSMDFASREKEVIAFWNSNKIFERSMENRAGKKEFSFYDGPPTANGKPHIGHILTRVMKDIIPRFQTMKGKFVRRKAGWDTHGLPVELEVEKKLGFDGKGDIEKYGIEPFVKQCKESVFVYQQEWEKMSERVGYWVDMENPYITYEDSYIESVWWALKQIFDKGLIYKGHKIVPYCPRCGTALSSHEVAQGYKDVEEISCVAKFKLKNQDNTYILAWTTTPWTLPSNVALCVHPMHDYVTVEKDGERFILAKALLDKNFKDGDYTVLNTQKGKELEKLEYEPLFDYDIVSTHKKACHYIVCDKFVTLNDGTGVVHIAPAFGEDDASVGKKYDLPVVQMVGADGKFIDSAGELAGIFCKDADKLIFKDLKIRGLLHSKIPYKHSYPFCWRCDKPLIYYARATWFIEVTKVKKQLLKNSNSVNWIPDNIKKGRMGDFLENVIDWGISRERYWGTPLPLWICQKCDKIEAMGSKEELKTRGSVKGDIELHKPYVDGVVLECSCGGKMLRTPEVIDCWFDSGAMPFASLHYPFENEAIFKTQFPADFISEAVDQTRGWFYTLLAISTLLFNKAPFKNCIVLGHVNDKDGKKMSKHIGNVVDPWTILDKQGADAVRWYFYTSSAPWLPSRFYEEAVSEAQRKFLGTLWNVCSFYSLYAKIDSFDPSKYTLAKCELSMMDKWILSELNTLVAFVDSSLSKYKITESARAIESFTDTLSNWFVRRNRERFWGNGMTKDKIAAYTTLYTVLETLSKLIAPYTPFLAESMWQSLTRPYFSKKPISVHLCDFPKVDKKRIDEALQNEMAILLDATVLGRAARAKSNIKNRQPLSKLLLAGDRVKGLSASLIEVLKDELNVKAVEFITSAGEYIDYDVKPQLKTLGPKYGKKLSVIREHLQNNGKEIVDSMAEKSVYSFTADGEKIELTADDILVYVTSKEGFSAESLGELAVILDTGLTTELIEEGQVREVISKLQALRKETGLEVTDRIIIYFEGNDGGLFTKWQDKINSVTLAENIIKLTEKEGKKSLLSKYTTVEIGQEKVSLYVDKQ